MALLILETASLYNRDPIMRLADAVVLSIYEALGTDLVILSGTDGDHGTLSWHYGGYATDYRTKHLSDEQKNFLRLKLDGDLPPHFRGSIEDPDHQDEHLHVEYTRHDAWMLPVQSRVPFHPPLIIP